MTIWLSACGGGTAEYPVKAASRTQARTVSGPKDCQSSYEFPATVRKSVRGKPKKGYTVAPTGSQPRRVCQPGCFLETVLLYLPQAALRLFPCAIENVLGGAKNFRPAESGPAAWRIYLRSVFWFFCSLGSFWLFSRFFSCMERTSFPGLRTGVVWPPAGKLFIKSGEISAFLC